MCEWRLGRQALEAEGEPFEFTGDETLQPGEIIACLKRIQKSIQFWQKRGGRRAYFEFVQRFVG